MSLMWLYYFFQLRFYQATLTFMLSDASGMPLPSSESDTIIKFLLSSDEVSETDFHDTILLSRNGDLINLAFKAETAEEAQKGLESLFSGFSKEIIKQNQKSLSAIQDIRQQYDKKLLLNIVQDFRSSIGSTIYYDAKQVKLNKFYVQLTDATLKRIHFTILSSNIEMMKKNNQSLLSLSFIAKNSAIVTLKEKLDLLATQKAHMVAQLGWKSPQIKAIIAESEALSVQLEDTILQIVSQIRSDEMIARDFERQLSKRISTFVNDQHQSLNQMLNTLENDVKAVIDAQNKQISAYRSLSKNIKIHIVTPVAVTLISFVDFYGKNVLFVLFASFIAFLGGLLLFQKYFEDKTTESREENLKKSENILLSKAIKTFESFITMKTLSNFLKSHSSTVVSIIGPEAARIAAKLSLHLIEDRKTVLLVDISGQKIEKVIGPHRGLSDILIGDAQLQDVIYRDYDAGVDILPRGLASAIRAQNFSHEILSILEGFKKDYDVIILEIGNEPKYGFEQIARSTEYYICGVALNEYDWIMQMTSRFPRNIYRVIPS
ncbi:hypothetical protein H710_00728 [Bartonella bacilliformis Ver097]|uniref:Polysaccharide chain length determinant N-terminal domain-containing protein n=2 Tax=Bartonella bacilliformis TaxID=774 RepID=A0A072R306_BARBA|nr:hypothetical protein H710_00728 [Bartonella bacilliformis Ver097]